MLSAITLCRTAYSNFCKLIAVLWTTRSNLVAVALPVATVKLPILVTRRSLSSGSHVELVAGRVSFPCLAG